MPKDPISPELLDKYLLCQCTVDETRRVEAWYAAQRGEKDGLSMLSELERQLLEEETLKNIRTRIGFPFDNEAEVSKKISFWRNRVIQMGIAASFLLVCWGAWGYFQSSQQRVQADAIVFEVQKSIPQEALVRFVNNEAKLVIHRLPDGTQVWLHPKAELTYPKTFDDHSRHVTFMGEGFFDVAHDKSRPFFIQSDKMQIRVLGTKFNVKALPKQAIFQVSVVSGSVAVRGAMNNGKENAEMVILKPQQKAFFEVATNHLTALEPVVQAKKEIFEPISINFSDTPLHEVVKQLESRFDTHIQLSDKGLSKCLLTADFNNQSLPVIMEILCVSLNVTYTVSDDKLILKGAGCD